MFSENPLPFLHAASENLEDIKHIDSLYIENGFDKHLEDILKETLV